MSDAPDSEPTSATVAADAAATAAVAAPDAGELLAGTGHEQVVSCADPQTGLRAIIAIHSTALGPALGGTRFLPYASYAEALADALRLSRAMSYKNAVSGLPHGGGKAVIIGDPRTAKTPALLHAYGRFVQTLGGRYVTACDVGTTVADLDLVGETTAYATGRSRERGGCGDSSVLTAYGVFQGMRAAAEHVHGTSSLAGLRVGIAGVGKVGRQLAAHVVADGGSVIVADVDAGALQALRAEHPGVEVAASAEELAGLDLDVYAPCALGGALDARTVEALCAGIVCGGANNQLVTEGLGGTADRLAARGITYCPDFLVNAGGVIQVSDELHGFDLDRAKAKAGAIFDHTLEVLRSAAAGGITPAAAADRIAEERMARGGRTPWVPVPGTSDER